MVDFHRVNSTLRDDVRYRQKTGKLLAHRIGQLFAELGYHTWICRKQSNGVDLKVWNRDYNLFIVPEILNWAHTTKLPDKRKREIIDNLSEYKCNKLLIYTTMCNEYELDDLRSKGISTLKIGYQILAKFFYYRLGADQLEGRKIDSRETRLLIKSKLLEYIQSLNNNSQKLGSSST